MRVREIMEDTSETPAVLRLALGGAILAFRKLAELITEWNDMSTGEQGRDGPTGENQTATRLLLGLAAAVSVASRQVSQAARPIWDRFISGLSQETLTEPLESLAGILEKCRVALVELGESEELKSVALARAAFRDAVDRVLTALGTTELATSMGRSSRGGDPIE